MNITGCFGSVQVLETMAKRFARVQLRVDGGQLSEGDQRALGKLIEAGRAMDDVFIGQIWSGHERLRRELEADGSALGKARLRLFWINKGPWSGLDGQAAFLPGVPERKPPGADFYPVDMTAAEFEAWTGTLTGREADAARSFFTVIRRDGQTGRLQAVRYSAAYAAGLGRAAGLLREAAALTENASLGRFLRARANAFLSNDYFESDVAWMDVDAPIDVTIGPYETYNDELFGYKASFEAYVCLTDEGETEKVRHFSRYLQEVEDHLPIEAAYRNPKLGAATPIRVVNEVLAAGDGNHGVQAAAFNLPNDERVIQQKGSKKVMLKNVQHAKFESALTPISKIVLPAGAQTDLSFHWFFTHILAHELSHGIGPHEIQVNGRKTSVRLALKDAYSAIEEAKADITGLFMLQYFFNRGILESDEADEKKLYHTFLASAFRTLRFGIEEAHGRGMAVQFNYLTEHGAFLYRPDGTFEVNLERIKQAVTGLTREILTIEAQGDYAGAKRMLSEFGAIRPEVARTLARLEGIPVDIEPVFVTADAIAPRHR